MFVNALHTPILVATTLIALFVFERDLSWLRRLHIVKGLPLAVTLASPWMIVRFQQDGVPFSGMEFGKFLAALGGAQDMKLRAFPGTFAIAALLGFLPGTALLAPALEAPVGRSRASARCALSARMDHRLHRLSGSAVVEARHLHRAGDVPGDGTRRCPAGHAARGCVAAALACASVAAARCALCSGALRAALRGVARDAADLDPPAYGGGRGAVCLERGAGPRGPASRLGEVWHCSVCHCSPSR